MVEACKSQRLTRDSQITFYHDLTRMAASATSAYLDIYIGHREEYDKDDERYKKTKEVLEKNAVIYGFPDDPEQLSVEQQEILKELDVLLRYLFERIVLVLTGSNVEVAGHAVHCAQAVFGWKTDIRPGSLERVIKDGEELCCAVHGGEGDVQERAE